VTYSFKLLFTRSIKRQTAHKMNKKAADKSTKGVRLKAHEIIAILIIKY